jgi:hypothetical protein
MRVGPLEREALKDPVQSAIASNTVEGIQLSPKSFAILFDIIDPRFLMEVEGFFVTRERLISEAFQCKRPSIFSSTLRFSRMSSFELYIFCRL